MKTRYIFNPCSGKNRRNPWLAQAIPAFIAEHGLDVRMVVIEHSAPSLFPTDGETHEGDARLEVSVNRRHLRITVPTTRAKCDPLICMASRESPEKELA